MSAQLVALEQSLQQCSEEIITLEQQLLQKIALKESLEKQIRKIQHG